MKVGEKYKILFGPERTPQNTLHIRAIVDGQVVYRFWVRRKGCWFYKVDSLYYFDLLKKDGRLVKR